MNCRSLIKELANYFDGCLDETVRKAIEGHISDCADCRVVVDTTKKTIQIFCNSEPLPLPEDARERLHQALAKRLGRHKH